MTGIEGNVNYRSEKPSNPKDSLGIKKAPMSTVSAPFVLNVGNAMLEGALKYGRHNYREVGVRSSVYYDALMRHMMAWWEGEDLDPESGVSHVIKAAACLAVLFDSMHQGNLNDDRPPKAPKDWQLRLNNVAHALIDKYPNPKPAVTEVYQSGTRPIGRVEHDLTEEMFQEMLQHAHKHGSAL